MFINSLAEEMRPFNDRFIADKTPQFFLKFDVRKKEERFLLLLEVLKYSDTFDFGNFEDPEVIEGFEANTMDIYVMLNAITTYSTNDIIVKSKLIILALYIAREFIVDVNPDTNYDLIKGVYNRDLPIAQFLVTGTLIRGLKNPFSFVGKSGTVYSGYSQGEMKSFTKVECMDIIEGLKLEGDVEKVREYIVSNEVALTKKHTNYRNILQGFFMWMFDQTKRNTYVVEILNELKIKHDFEPESEMINLSPKVKASKIKIKKDLTK